MFAFWYDAGDSPYTCWCCSRAIDGHNGISLNDNVVDSVNGLQMEVHVCRKCWDKVPVQHRIWIRLLALDRSKGGIGGPEFLEMFQRVLSATMRSYRAGEKFDDLQGGDGRWN